MKYHNLFLILCCVIAAPFTRAMENTKDKLLNCSREITTVTNPLKARYITEKSILIDSFSDEFKYHIHIVDLKTQNSSLINESSYMPQSQVHDKKVLMHSHQQLNLYNTEKNIQEWSWEKPIHYITALAWKASKNTVFLCHGSRDLPLTQYNYLTNTITQIPIKHPCHTMAIHPKQDIMCLVDYDANFHLYKIENLQHLKKISLNNNRKSINFCHYTSDGSRIITGNANAIYFIDPNIDQTVDADKYPCIKNQKEPYAEVFSAIAVHPTMPIMAILCNIIKQSKLVIRYFNINTQKFIETSPEIISKYGYSLDFSPNGFNIIAAVEGKCVEMSVSFLHEMRKKYLYLLFAVKQINEQHNTPQDITNYSTQILLNTFGL